MPVKLSQDVSYSNSDDRPMADNTQQFRWIVLIKENLEILFAEATNVFVAGSLPWYPIEGDRAICQTPDVMVVFGRSKGDRSSYCQWQEANTAPQVVFEVPASGSQTGAMQWKLAFYDRFGVEEYYIYDPNTAVLAVWQRGTEGLEKVKFGSEWTSPLLGARFDLSGKELALYGPQGRQFLSLLELDRQRQQERQAKEQAQAELAAERQRCQELLAQLQARGIDPEARRELDTHDFWSS